MNTFCLVLGSHINGQIAYLNLKENTTELSTVFRREVLAVQTPLTDLYEIKQPASETSESNL